MTLSRRSALLPILAGIAIFAAACGGLSESEWRRELEPLLPDGVTIVHSKTGNCGIEPNCSVSFELEHDRSRYTEDVATFESTIVAEAWTKADGGQNSDSANASFERKGIRVTMRLLSESWRERCVSIYGLDGGDCKSTLVVQN